MVCTYQLNLHLTFLNMRRIRNEIRWLCSKQQVFIHSSIFESRLRIKRTKGNKCYLEKTATFWQDIKYGGIHIDNKITTYLQSSINLRWKLFSLEVRYWKYLYSPQTKLWQGFVVSKWSFPFLFRMLINKNKTHRK